jgi:2-methylcitrate dehydratase PrpD
VSYALHANPDVAVDQLGKVFEIATLAYKPYPSGFVIHPVIDACLELAKNHVIDPTQIERIELTINPLTPKLTNIVDPVDRGEALVSFQHWAAVTLVHNAAGIAQCTNEVVRDPLIAALRRKVAATSLDSVGTEAASVGVVLKNGARLQASVANCRGSAGRPLTDDDISAKTRDQLRAAFAAERSEQILAQCWRIAELPKVDSFSKQLAGV